MRATIQVVSICVIMAGFVIFSACSKPAFSASNLDIKPSEVLAGDVVQISIVVKNTGDAQGSIIVNLKIDGVTKNTEEVSLQPGQTKTVTFSATENEGIHDVNVAGITGTFSVKRLEPLTITTDTVPPIKLTTLIPIKKSDKVPEDFTFSATGGAPPYIWTWKFPDLITNPNPGIFNILVIYKPITRSGEGIAQVALSLTPQGTISGGFIMAVDSNKQFIVPEFYPNKIVRVPVTVTVKDGKGNAQSKDFHLELMMSD